MAIPVNPNRSKQPLLPVAGPYGHPFHPALVAIPIGSWAASLIFDIANLVHSAGSASLLNGAYWLIGLGVVGAALAAVFGLLDLLTIPRATRAFRIGLTHMSLNLIVVAIFVVAFFWRHASLSASPAPVKVQAGQLALSIVGIGLLLISGWLGGMLAYRFGVRVADETTQSEGFAAGR
jgi:uncharacterized membrane protein